jgi:hypothetical protein
MTSTTLAMKKILTLITLAALALTVATANAQLTNPATIAALKNSLQPTPGWEKRLQFSDSAQVIEAESGKFIGTVERHCCWRFVALNDVAHSSFTGQGAVDIKNEVGSHIEFEVTAQTAGPHTLVVRYVHQKTDDRSGEVRVNGAVAVPSLAFPSVGYWTVWGVVSNTIPLQAGRNVIRLTSLHAGGLPNLDHFEIVDATGATQLIEAEDSTFDGKPDHHDCWGNIVNSRAKLSTFSGKGYVDSTNAIGSSLEIFFDAKTAGEQTLYVRYVHGKTDARPGELRVNDTVVNPSLAFPPTGGWTAWSVVSNTIPVQAGRNVIRLTALSTNGLVNVDHFEIAP